jgi:glycosyltransferase involved in cell wall biosynthesis
MNSLLSQNGENSKNRVLLISGYDAASHQYWRQTLSRELPDYEWSQIALADRYYAWRIRGNGFVIAEKYATKLAQEYDCLILTSMVDFNSLRGFCPQLANIPSIVYCHENQFVYPQNGQSQEQANRLNAQLSAIYSMQIADRVIFNSDYNKMTFFKGAKALFKKLPDGVSVSNIERIEQKSKVLPVPIDVVNNNLDMALVKSCTNNRKQLQSPVSIVWNHRWEFDKQPEVFFDALRLLSQQGIDFRLNLLGQSFRKIPACFHVAEREFADKIDYWGFQSRSIYQQVLNQADIVVSTAIHDFQGLSMLEAILSGCIPVAPNRVVYPEYIDQQLLYSPSSHQTEAESLAVKLKQVATNLSEFQSNRRLIFRDKAKRYRLAHLIPEYRREIDDLLVKTTS